MLSLTLCVLVHEARLLVYDWKIKSILQLAFEDRKLHPVHQLKLEIIPLRGMSYCESNGTVILSNLCSKQIAAITLATGDVEWQHTEFADSDNWVELEPEGVCATLNGLVLVANGINLLVLNCSSEELVDTLGIDLDHSCSVPASNFHVPTLGTGFIFPDTPRIRKVLWSDYPSQRLAVRYDEQKVVVFDAIISPAESHVHVNASP